MNEFCIIENNCSFNIRDVNDLDEHMDCLLRTDANQMWTNQNTLDDRIGLATNNKMYMFNNIESRKMLRRYLKEDIETFFFKFFGNQNFNEIFPKYLFTFTLYLYDFYEDKIVMTPDFLDFNPNLILRKFDNHALANLFALTFHQDERTSAHLHGLFFFDDTNYGNIWDRIFDVLNYIAVV